LLLLVLLASTRVADAQTDTAGTADSTSDTTPTLTVPTVSVPEGKSVTVPTVTLPQPTPTATTKPKPKKRSQHHPAKKPKRANRAPKIQVVRQQWILAYLTNYCPGSAGSTSASGIGVYYGMLANNFYAFGTRVYLPVLGMTGTVYDRVGGLDSWNHFDVWSPTCYGTPTGWFKVAIVG
jgi:hypothetical protein